MQRVFLDNGAPDFMSRYCPDPKGLEPPIDEYLSTDTRQRTIEKLREHQSIARAAYFSALLNDHKLSIIRYRNIFDPAFPEVDTLYR